jgi:PPP family 3-phenylpropionic acid transporter
MAEVLTRFRGMPLGWLLAFLYAALFLVVGCYLPYMPVWLHWRRLDEDAIALLLATPLFARTLFTPAISFAADWFGARRTVLIVLAWGSLLSFVLLWASGSFWQMLLATLLLAANWTTIMPLIEAVSVIAIRRAVGLWQLHRGQLRLRADRRRRRRGLGAAAARWRIAADCARRLSRAA